MQSFVKHIREVAAKDRKLADDAFHKEGMTRREGFHAGAAAALGAVADELEERLTGILDALDEVYSKIAYERHWAEINGERAVADKMADMEALLREVKGLLCGDLSPESFKERAGVAIWYAKHSTARA